jgi:hypothetical protein
VTKQLVAALGRKPTFAESLLALQMKKAGFSLPEIVGAVGK